MSRTVLRAQVGHARELARILLADMPERWLHTIGVAHRAAELAATVPSAEREILVAAAWLHDIGYADEARETGFHPLDGARYLDRREWPVRLSALVAHHSGACFVAEARGLGAELGVFGREESALADALTYADQTVGPAGLRMTPEERGADMLRRHGSDSPNGRVHHLRRPYLLAIAERVERRLTTTG